MVWRSECPVYWSWTRLWLRELRFTCFTKSLDAGGLFPSQYLDKVCGLPLQDWNHIWIGFLLPTCLTICRLYNRQGPLPLSCLPLFGGHCHSLIPLVELIANFLRPPAYFNLLVSRLATSPCSNTLLMPLVESCQISKSWIGSLERTLLSPTL